MFAKRELLIILVLVLNPFIKLDTAYQLNAPPPYCSDYEMLIVNTRNCVSRCPLRCLNGVCFEDGECPCANSYVTSCKWGLICAQQCLPGCIEAGGYCAAPNICLCRHKSYFFDPVWRKCRKFSIFKDLCAGRCRFGHCSYNGVCTCARGYRYDNNTIFGQLCVPQCKQNCGAHGYCFLPNMCACRKKHHHYDRDGKCHHDDDFIY